MDIMHSIKKSDICQPVNKPSLLFPVHPPNRHSVSKLSHIATITNFSIPLPSSTRNPGIIPSDDLGEVLLVSS